MRKIAKSEPLVSVVMSVYNADKFLHKSIESILNQTYHDFEFIILDNRSSDRSLKIAKKYSLKDKRIKIIANSRNLGPALAKNKGFKITKGKYTALMDADDISEKDRLHRQVEFLIQNPKIDVCICNLIIINERGKKLKIRRYPTNDQQIRSKIFKYNPIPNPTVICKSEVLKEFSYDPNYSLVYDFDLWIRVGTKYKFGNINEALYKYRFTDSGLLRSNVNKVEREILKIRLKAMKKLGYKPTPLDIIYNLVELVGYKTLSPGLKIKIYNYFRSKAEE